MPGEVAQATKTAPSWSLFLPRQIAAPDRRPRIPPSNVDNGEAIPHQDLPCRPFATHAKAVNGKVDRRTTNTRPIQK